MIRPIRYVAAAVLLVLVSAGLLPAQQVAVPEHVPSGARVIVSINDANAMWSALGQTAIRRHMQRLLASPAVTSDPGYQDFKLAMDKAALELGYGLQPDELLGKVLRGVDIYLTRESSAAAPSVVLIAAFNEEKNAKALADYLRKQIAEQSAQAEAAGMPALTMSESEVAGLTVTSVPSQELHFGAKGPLFLAGTSTAVLQDALESPGAERLAQIAPLAIAMRRMGEETRGQVFFYVEGDQVGNLARMLPDMPLPADQLGADTTAGVVSFAPGRIDARTFSVGSTGFGVAQSTQADVLRYATANPLIAYSTNLLEGEQLREQLQSGGFSAAMPGVGPAMQQIASLEEQLGISLEEDVLPAFGPEVSLLVNSFNLQNIMSVQVDMLVVVGVKDEAKARNVMQALESLTHQRAVEQLRALGMNAQSATPVEETHQGVVIRSVPYRNPMLNAPMGLSYAFTESGHVLIGLEAAAIRQGLDRASGGGLLDSAQWSAAQQNLPSTFNQLVLVDFQGVGNLLAGFLPLLGGLMQPGEADLTVLTTAVDMIKSMGTMYSAASLGAEGSVNQTTLLLGAQ